MGLLNTVTKKAASERYDKLILRDGRVHVLTVFPHPGQSNHFV